MQNETQMIDAATNKYENTSLNMWVPPMERERQSYH